MNFILRIHQTKGTRIPILTEIQDITISNITLISKPTKNSICYHNSNKKKFKYSIELSKKFIEWAGSHSYPILTFKGDYIDIIIKDFPKFPCFCQSTSAANSNLTGYGLTNYHNKGFPIWHKYREIEIIIL